ncbi:MAG: dihydropteroate synthase [Bacteroidota bacterium]|nr:dihydropteroate synthase [Bacteroidota bacterium]
MKAQDTQLHLFCGNLSLDLSRPVIMGILNLTPDSFYDGGKFNSAENALKHAAEMVADGARIIDIGAVSTRPGAHSVSANEEWERMKAIIPLLRSNFPDTILSVDTYRSGIAEKAVEAGAHIINDISGGTLDDKMFETVGRLNVPYVLMHIKGTPETMQKNPEYENVVEEVKQFFEERIVLLQAAGVKQIIPDPGFGFGKTLEHNYQLLNSLEVFTAMGFPVLAGLSRKSMITKLYGGEKKEALAGTIEVNKIALQKGAKILRVHDVKEAMQLITNY